MIKIENIEVSGWAAAIRGMRNPLNSWEKSDTTYTDWYFDVHRDKFYVDYADIGDADMELMQKLIKAGTDHSKFMRFINVTMDITAPLYFWKQADQYKVGTVTNSTSTMHTIHKKEFTLDDFSHDKLSLDETNFMSEIIHWLNVNRETFIESNNKENWWNIIQLLPESFNQMRTWQANYEVLRNIYFARKDHKLDEWREFCRIMIDELPYFAELIGVEENE